MVPLDAVATRITIRAIDKMGDQNDLDLIVRRHPLLRLHKGDMVQTESGPGYLFSMGTLYHAEPPKYEAKMILIVADQRDRQSWTGPVTIYPVSWHDDYNNVYEYAVHISGNRVQKFDAVVQQTLVLKARDYFGELLLAGYF